ncbi:MAG TPA: hypothetical protein VGO55_03005 [Allosphingosinicella sp.]|jgi:hypothetical protein|nr:hypothetical protein [Allosphingosinicella sp.]
MTKSRTLPGLLLLGIAGPAASFGQSISTPDPAHEEAAPPQPGTDAAPTIVTADEAVAMSRRQVSDMVARTCPPGAEDSDVVVCGRRAARSPYRLPLPVAPTPGTGERAGGAQRAAMEAGDTYCSAVGRDQQCGGGFDMIGIGFAIVRGIAQALINRD